MSGEWKLIEATPSDREFARCVHHDAYRDVVTRQFGRWDSDEQDRFFEGDWDGRDYSVIVVDGEPCGYCSIEHRPADVHVRELVISPRHQRRGLGTAILRSVMRAAEERSVPVVLGTLHENQARRLYERLGFREFDSTETHVLMRWAVPSEIDA